MEYKLTVTLPQKFSLNQYERMFYLKRNTVKHEFYEAVKFATREGMLTTPPYDIHYHFMLWGAKMDLSNLMGMIKPLEDGMVRCGILEDDNHNIVQRLTITEERAPESSIRNKRSYCIITIKGLKQAEK